MVLYFKTGDGRWLTWYFSEPLPGDELPRVLTIQCDGGERDLVLETLRSTSEKVKTGKKP